MTDIISRSISKKNEKQINDLNQTVVQKADKTQVDTLSQNVTNVTAQLAQKAPKPLVYGELEMPSDFKPKLPCTFYRDNDGIIKHNMDFSGRYRGGKKIYVTLDGNDSSGNGSQSKPYRTITKAIQLAVEGIEPKYEIITNIPTLNRMEFTFNQTIINKTIAIISEDSYTTSALQRNEYNTNLSELDADWKELGAGLLYTNVINGSFTKEFYGTELALGYRKDSLGGVFEVVVDGKPSLARTISTHSTTNENLHEVLFTGLSEEVHTVKITFLGGDPEVSYGGTPRGTILASPTFKSSYLDFSKAYKHTKNKTIVSSNESYSWTLDGTGVYKTVRSAVRTTVDLLNVDIYGIPKPLLNVATLAECKSTKNSWYSDGTNVWVHRKDEAQPSITNTIINIGTNSVNPKVGQGGVIYFENFIFTSSIDADALKVKGLSGTPYGEVCFRGCGYVGRNNSTSFANGLTTEDIKNVFVFDSIAAYAERDGFNYHYENITESLKRDCLVVEYNCKAYDLGLNFPGSQSNNASSCHNGASIVRFGTIGYRNTGAVIIDVNACYSVLYDCNPRTPMQDLVRGNGRAFSFSTEGLSPAGKTYMFNCGATDANTSLVIDSTHIGFINNFRYDGVITATGQLNFI